MPLYSNQHDQTLGMTWGNIAGRWSRRQYSSTASLMTSNTLRMMTHPIYAPITLDALGLEITTVGSVGSLIRLGVYRCSDTTGVPATLMQDLGTISGEAGTGVTTVTSIGLRLDPGLYAWGAVSQNAPATHPTVREVASGVSPASPATGAASSDLFGSLSWGWNLAAVSGALAASIAPSPGDRIPVFTWKWAA